MLCSPICSHLLCICIFLTDDYNSECDYGKQTQETWTGREHLKLYLLATWSTAVDQRLSGSANLGVGLVNICLQLLFLHLVQPVWTSHTVMLVWKSHVCSPSDWKQSETILSYSDFCMSSVSGNPIWCEQFWTLNTGIGDHNRHRFKFLSENISTKPGS